MDTETALQSAEELLLPWTRWAKRTDTNALTVSISRDDLLAAVKALLDAKWGYLAAITGLHLAGVDDKTEESKKWARLNEEIDHQMTPEGESFLVLYQFCEGAAVLTVRTHPRTDPSVPSICALIPSASLYEREIMEMFGVDVIDTPNRDKLILPENWPDGVYPLRKTFKGLQDAQQA